MSLLHNVEFKSKVGFIVLLFYIVLVLWDCRVQHLFESRVALTPGLGGVRDVASAIFSHEQTQ